MFYFLLFSVTARIGGIVSVIYPDKMLTIVYQLSVLSSQYCFLKKYIEIKI